LNWRRCCLAGIFFPQNQIIIMSILLFVLLLLLTTTTTAMAETTSDYQACWKSAQTRGAPSFPDRKTHQCPPDKSEKSGALCYDKCPAQFHGVGAICWETCKDPFTVSSLTFCCADDATCSDLVSDLSQKLPEALLKFAIDLAANADDVQRILQELEDIVRDVLQIALPLCKNVKPNPLLVDVA
jgi:hypothetical protein